MRSLPYAALALVGLTSACTSILGISGDYGPLAEGGGGQGGSSSVGGSPTGVGASGSGGATQLELGAPCGDDAQCASGFCSDFFCCDAPCDSACVSCAMDETGVADGTCAPVFDTLDECNGPEVCIAGACGLKPAGYLCSHNNQCIDTCSAEGVCCDATCGSGCESCLEVNTGTSDGTCAPIPMGQDPLMACAADETCNGMGACKKVDGASCINNGAVCLSGICIDGVCCDAACDQPCEGCTMTLTGMADGTCAPIPAGQDPDGDCGATSCDGAGMCQ